MTVSGTIDAASIGGTCWDAVIVGAGPAGSLAAQQLALRGHRTVLIDRCAFPRRKVCGGFLNARATALLTQLGLQQVLCATGAMPTRHFHLHVAGRSLCLDLPEGYLVSREALDTALIRAAIDAGAEFLPETHAHVAGLSADGCFRTVQLSRGGHAVPPVCGQYVLAADGLGHPAVTDADFKETISPQSRIGLGTILEHKPSDLPAHTITMAVGCGGYVGMSEAEQQRVNLAAALDADFLQRMGSPCAAVSSLLEQAGVAVPKDLDQAVWQGTRPLTRHVRDPASLRLLLLGDAVGYVEPFTGEGMAWALTSGVAVAHLVAGADQFTSAQIATRWKQLHRSLIGDRQTWCRWMAWLLRRTRAVRCILPLLSAVPQLARFPIARLNTTPAELTTMLCRSRFEMSAFQRCAEDNDRAGGGENTMAVPCRNETVHGRNCRNGLAIREES